MPPDVLLTLFKLTVTPLLVGLASLAARRWGNTVAGLIAGLPLMTGPISIFLALEQGPAFTVATTTGILIALTSIAGYSLAYAVAARFAPWPIAILSAYGAFFLTAWLISPLITERWQAIACAYGAICIGIILIPRYRLPETPPRIPWWEIWLRMLATAAMIALVTTTASLLGPTWTGIIATVPVLATVMAMFTHARWGHQAVTRFIRSMMLSMIAFTTFFVIVAYGLERFGIVETYIVATLIALIISPLVASLDRSIAALTTASSRKSPAG